MSALCYAEDGEHAQALWTPVVGESVRVLVCGPHAATAAANADGSVVWLEALKARRSERH